MPRFVRNKEGWAVFSGQPGIDTENRSWQLYISVKPTRENLVLALNALDTLALQDPFFRDPQHPTIKIALPEDPNKHSHYFDVILPPPMPHMMVPDHDQMGREISISLDYDSTKHNYTYEPTVYKDLILKIWAILEKAKVELNYVTPDLDELVINCDDDILTPFCYSSRKDELRHGLLFCSEANPKKFSDPLDRIHISTQDLKAYNISGGEAATVCYKRLDFQEERNARSKYAIQQYMAEFIKITRVVPNCQTVLQSIQAMIAITDNEEFLKSSHEFLNKINEWKSFLPRRANAKLTYIFDDNEIKQCLIKTDTAAKVKALREFWQDLILRSQEEIKQIKTDMSTTQSANKKMLEDAIDANPVIAQSIFRIMIHLENAENRQEREQKRLLHDCRFPSNYQKIWDETKGDLYEKSRALLRDYTKDDSFVMRMFSGHINRDEAQIKAVGQILNSSQSNNFVKLMGRLKSIHLKDFGSLGRRIAFIMKKNYEELIKLDAAAEPQAAQSTLRM